MTIGQRIKKARAKMTQEELAEKCKIGYSTLKNYERDITEPTISTIKEIAKATNTNIYELAFGVSDRKEIPEIEIMISTIESLNKHDRDTISEIIEAMSIRSDIKKRLQK